VSGEAPGNVPRLKESVGSFFEGSHYDLVSRIGGHFEKGVWGFFEDMVVTFRE